jgi:4-hydroxy-2-oxoglutarate aldolase
LPPTCPPSGVFAPVATIFDGDGMIDAQRLGDNLEFYAGSELDGVVLLGSNGEFATLDHAERMRVIELGTETIAGRKTVMAGTGAESTRATIETTRAAASLGIDYALVITPHYYKTRYDKQAYLNHFLKVAEASPVPILIYVMAAYTGVDLASSIVCELAHHPNIVGVKDSGGNSGKVAQIIAGAGEHFAVLAGSANFLYPALCLGAKGGILALGNIAPRQCAELYRLWEAGEHELARRLQLRMIAPNAAVTSGFGIAGLKAALEMVGLNGGVPREPLLPLTAAERGDLADVLKAAGIDRVG